MQRKGYRSAGMAMSRYNRGRSYFDDRPTAAEQVRQAAQRLAGGDVNTYATQEARRIREAQERQLALGQHLRGIINLEIVVAAVTDGEEPSRVAPEAVAAFLLKKEADQKDLLNWLRETYEADAVGDADRQPPRPNFPSAGGVVLGPSLEVDNSWLNTLHDIQNLPES